MENEEGWERGKGGRCRPKGETRRDRSREGCRREKERASTEQVKFGNGAVTKLKDDVRFDT